MVLVAGKQAPNTWCALSESRGGPWLKLPDNNTPTDHNHCFQRYLSIKYPQGLKAVRYALGYLVTGRPFSKPSPPISTAHWWTLKTTDSPAANEDIQFWWTKIGYPLAALLENAGYSTESQRRYLLFFYSLVAPDLGPTGDRQRPSRLWNSFMTDHSTPIELSWEWGSSCNDPIVRFSFEPIGTLAGTTADPLNQHATTRVLNQYQQLLPGCDLTLFHHFSQELLSYDHSSQEMEKSMISQGHRSRTFVAVECGESEVMVKAYFFPVFKALKLGCPTWVIISQAIQNLPGYTRSAFESLSTLEDFLQTSAQGSKLVPEIFAIDCVAAAASRLKIYMRSRSTNFDSVRDIMTLNGVLGNSETDRGFQELCRLWKLVFPQAQNASSATDLCEKDHRTAGILYYFDFKQDRNTLGVKVYIPVRHYGENDLSVAKGLAMYLKSCNKDAFVEKYIASLRAVSLPNSLESQFGLQTYLGCSIVNDELKLTSYLAPKLYETGH
ncbi:MAG: hypothetical protein LQ351_007836 [Letrouitia transgressa]|nr:MAG: hypothetical protein LQ351_007836 [Letrouitia transgressa]